MFHNNKITAFLTLAETLSYTKTAKLLYMSQQSVSRCIASIEDELETQLFIRNTRNVALTAAGRKYYDLFNTINQEYEEGILRIRRETQGEGSKGVRVGVQSYMETAPIIRVIERVKAVLPLTTVQVVVAPPSVLLDQFGRELVDFVMLLERFLPEGFEAARTELIVNPLYLMVSDTNPKATEGATFEDLMTLPYISDMLEGEDNLAHNARLKHEVDKWSLVPDEILWTYDRDSALMYAELGYGIVIDSDRSRMIEGRALKMYDTGKTESLLLLSRLSQKTETENMAIINAFEDEFKNIPEEILRREQGRPDSTD
ncbi:MAG: LysR family transcriptional regulator [Clostridiales Family XIII bacterium]|jgi:DNA-binding transcriptional LysR family regulator|nr:LysR family transcriptional regulator [Clostridiales Family XIII bacterium]